MSAETKNPTFDPAEFPERLGCRIMPALEDSLVDVELTDWDDNKVVVQAPSNAAKYLTMPRLSPDVRTALPEEIKQMFDASAGVGIIACRIANREDDTVAVDVPTVEGIYKIVVSSRALARRVSPPENLTT